ncbi:MAG: hypothetical protein ABIX19_17595 [Gemmatimonadaceae bacterium]
MRVAVLAMAAVLGAGRVALAQVTSPGLRPELRADVVAIGSRVAVQAGGGVQVPFGYYTRVGVIAAAGADLGRFDQDASARVDVIARFLFDPFRQQRWGVSAGGGVSARAVAGDKVRPYLVAVVDVEGRRLGSVSPALQLGVGGGVRVGIGLRWGAASSR